MIVQAYWVECYEARILAVKQNNPTKSSTEATMETLKEACSVFRWSEKELRNKLYCSIFLVLLIIWTSSLKYSVYSTIFETANTRFPGLFGVVIKRSRMPVVGLVLSLPAWEFIVSASIVSDLTKDYTRGYAVYVPVLRLLPIPYIRNGDSSWEP